uniref:Proline-rich protein 2 n=2 Tax=Lottia gigantea TaxID=225164 RepID=PRP2_LOTGI|nr:RecName: Full=Proline-rich protein 2; AltName: Full=Uncharacterized shell protein 21; Short=LUSP-21; Flags: Precursor [Lottia gigantea]
MNLKVGIAVLIIALIVPSAQPYIYRGYDRSSDPNFDMFGRSVAGDNAYRQPLRTLQSPAPMVPRAMPLQRQMYVPPRAPMIAPRVPIRAPMSPVRPGVLQTQPVMPIPYHHPHYYPGYDPPSYDPPDISQPDPPGEYFYHPRPRPNLGIYNPSRITAFNRAYLR